MLDTTILENLYRKYNRREYVSPDPLQFLYGYPSLCDREIVALVASSLAYGRVGQILKSVEKVLTKMGPSPHEFLTGASVTTLMKAFAGFKHRFTTGEELVAMLSGARKVLAKCHSLNECFVSGMNRHDSNILPGLQKFTDEIACAGNYLIPSPSRGSACKRMNLFLRWMVRDDAVDPGGWEGIPGSKLIVPLDTHMAQIGRMLGLTARKSANMAMAMDITAAFKSVAPRDPVKYDFALTRFGIRDGMDIAQLSQCLKK